MPVIESLNLTKNFGRNVALKNANIRVGERTLHLILGPNGSGKSTFIKIACGLLRPDAGKIAVLGLDPFKNWAKIHKKIGVVLDVYSPPKWASGYEFLKYVSMSKGISWPKIDELAELLEVKNYWKRIMFTYSSGMLKRIALIQALAGDYELIIMDEPFTHLDLKTQAKLRDLLHQFTDKSILVSTHYLGGLEKIAKEVTFLFNGEVLFSGAIGDIINKGKLLLLKTKRNKNLLNILQELPVRRIIIEGDEVRILVDKEFYSEIIRETKVEWLPEIDLSAIYEGFIK
jgi:ABC-type multidrug transport system ATPase subunit